MLKLSEWKTYERIRRFALEFAIAWLLFTAVVLSYNYIKQQQRELAPLDEYFIVRQIAVPNFPVGQNPVMIYDRTVNKQFRGHYTVEVQEAGTLQPIEECTGSFDINYDPDKQLPEGGPTLFWFIGHPCNIPIGPYRLQACWDVYRENASTIHYCRPSAIFNVFDPSNMEQMNTEQQQNNQQQRNNNDQQQRNNSNADQ
jgi:hypothetical protein